MNIKSTIVNAPVRVQRKIENRLHDKPVETQSAPEDGWVSAAFSVAGGVTSMAGAMTGYPLVSAGGALVTAAATAFTARRVQAQGALDSAALTSFVGGGSLVMLSAICLSVPPAQSVPAGPLPQLIERLGLHGL